MEAAFRNDEGIGKLRRGLHVRALFAGQAGTDPGQLGRDHRRLLQEA